MSQLLKRAWLATITTPTGQTTSTFDLSANGGISNTTAANQLQTDALRVKFRVVKTTEKEPNTMNLEIFNLSDASRSKMKAKGMTCVLEAGYLNTALNTNTRAVIFSGQSRLCDHTHDTATWESRIQCGDGEQLYTTDRIMKSYSAGTPFQSVIDDVAGLLKINQGNLDATLTSGGLPFQTFQYGHVVSGTVVAVFNDLMKTAGYTWSVQQGALQVVKAGQAVVQEVVVLNKDTGLIGSPEHTPQHKTKKPSFLTAKSLLNPKIIPGHIVRMDSLNVKGDFVVQKVTHSGDSHSMNDWTSHFEALASQSTVTPV